MYWDGVERDFFRSLQIKLTVGREEEEKIELMSSSGCGITQHLKLSHVCLLVSLLGVS